MKLDKRHLIAAFVLLMLSVVYNIWVYSRPARVTTAAVQNTDPGFASDPGLPPPAAPGASEDPMTLPAPPDVALDRLPRWPRDPFANNHVAPPVEIVAGEPAPVDVDPVVASILYSTDRKLAVMNGKIVRVGDQLGNDRIIEIQPSAVVVESPSRGRRTLSLRAPRPAAEATR